MLDLLRTLLIHTGYIDARKGWRILLAIERDLRSNIYSRIRLPPRPYMIQYFEDQDGGVVRLDFDHNHEP